MAAERQHRLDDRELKRLLDDLARPESEVEVPGKGTLAERIDQLAVILRHRAPAAAPKAHLAWPGQRALVGDMLTAAPKLGFSDCRALALRDVLSRLRNHRRLQEETLAAADPHVAHRVGRGEHGAQVTPQGQAMWGAATQRAVTLYRRATAAGIGAPETQPVAEAVGAIGTGVPLPADVRRKLEAALKVSLESVRLHTGSVARDAASAVNAEAFTVGEDIFFPGYDPLSSQCQETLAHEVVHCIQWRQGRISPTTGGAGVSRPDDPLEREAEGAAKAIVAHAFHAPVEPVRVTGHMAHRTATAEASSRTIAAISGPAWSTPPSRGPGVHMVMRKAGRDHSASERSVPQWRAEIPIGFVDHRDGAEVLTAPPGQGGKPVGKLAATARVWVNGAHPTVKDWLQVTEVPATRQAAGTAMLQGYVQASRVVTRLPEPGAVLYQVASNDTPEKVAAKKYGHLVRPGRDLRFYENVLLYVNQQEKRKGVAGTPQTPDVFGQRSNGIQLVAGERIWLVSAEYAELLAGTVGSGSLTGGLGGSGKHAWYQNPVLDVIKSSLWAPQHTVEDVAGEYAELLTNNMGAIAGTIGALVVAELASGAALAIPVSGPIIATMIQLGIAAFGIVVAAEAIEASADHGKLWIELAWTAKGDPEQLDEASREWWRMWVTLMLAGLAGKGAVRSIRKAGKYFNAPPRAGKGQSAGAAAEENPRDLHMTKLEETQGVGADGRPVTQLKYGYGANASANSAHTPAARSGTPPSRKSRKLLDDGLGIPAMAGGAPEKGDFVPDDKSLVPSGNGNVEAPEQFKTVDEVQKFLGDKSNRLKEISDEVVKQQADDCLAALLKERPNLPGLKPDLTERLIELMRIKADLPAEVAKERKNLLQTVINDLRLPLMSDIGIEISIKNDNSGTRIRGTAWLTFEEFQRRFSNGGQASQHPLAQPSVAHPGEHKLAPQETPRVVSQGPSALGQPVQARSGESGRRKAGESSASKKLTKDLEKSIKYLTKHLAPDDAQVYANFWRESVEGGHHTVQEALRATDASAYLRTKIPKYKKHLLERISGVRGLQPPSLNLDDKPEPAMREHGPGGRSSMEVAGQAFANIQRAQAAHVLTLEEFLNVFRAYHRAFGFDPFHENSPSVSTAYFGDDWLKAFRFIVTLDYEPSVQEFNDTSPAGLGYVTEASPDALSYYDGNPGANMLRGKNHDLDHFDNLAAMPNEATRFFARVSERIDFYQAFEKWRKSESPRQGQLLKFLYFTLWHEMCWEPHPIAIYKLLPIPSTVPEDLYSRFRFGEYTLKGRRVSRDDTMAAVVAFEDFVRAHVNHSSQYRRLIKFHEEMKKRFPKYVYRAAETPELCLDALNHAKSSAQLPFGLSPEDEVQFREFLEQHLAPMAGGSQVPGEPPVPISGITERTNQDGSRRAGKPPAASPPGKGKAAKSNKIDKVDADFNYIIEFANEVMPPSDAQVYGNFMRAAVYGSGTTVQEAYLVTDASAYLRKLPAMREDILARLPNVHQRTRTFLTITLKKIEHAEQTKTMTLAQYREICDGYHLARPGQGDEYEPFRPIFEVPRDLAVHDFNNVSPLGVGYVGRLPSDGKAMADGFPRDFAGFRAHDIDHYVDTAHASPARAEPFLSQTAERIRFYRGFVELRAACGSIEQVILDQIWFEITHEMFVTPDLASVTETLRNFDDGKYFDNEDGKKITYTLADFILRSKKNYVGDIRNVQRPEVESVVAMFRNWVYEQARSNPSTERQIAFSNLKTGMAYRYRGKTFDGSEFLRSAPYGLNSTALDYWVALDTLRKQGSWDESDLRAINALLEKLSELIEPDELEQFSRQAVSKIAPKRESRVSAEQSGERDKHGRPATKGKKETTSSKSAPPTAAKPLNDDEARGTSNQFDEDFATLIEYAQSTMPPHHAKVYENFLRESVHRHKTVQEAFHATDASAYIAAELPIMREKLRARLAGNLGLLPSPHDPKTTQRMELTDNPNKLPSLELARRALQKIEHAERVGQMTLAKYDEICRLYRMSFGHSPHDEHDLFRPASVTQPFRLLLETDRPVSYRDFNEAAPLGVMWTNRVEPNKLATADGGPMNMSDWNSHDLIHFADDVPMPDRVEQFVGQAAERVRFAKKLRELRASRSPKEQAVIDLVWFELAHEAHTPVDAVRFYRTLQEKRYLGERDTDVVLPEYIMTSMEAGYYDIPYKINQQDVESVIALLTRFCADILGL